MSAHRYILLFNLCFVLFHSLICIAMKITCVLFSASLGSLPREGRNLSKFKTNFVKTKHLFSEFSLLFHKDFIIIIS